MVWPFSNLTVALIRDGHKLHALSLEQKAWISEEIPTWQSHYACLTTAAGIQLLVNTTKQGKGALHFTSWMKPFKNSGL